MKLTGSVWSLQAGAGVERVGRVGRSFLAVLQRFSFQLRADAAGPAQQSNQPPWSVGARSGTQTQQHAGSSR